MLHTEGQRVIREGTLEFHVVQLRNGFQYPYYSGLFLEKKEIQKGFYYKIV